MQLFWGSIFGDTAILQGDEARHCSRVLRKQPGDEIEVIDGGGTLFHCQITGVAKNDVHAQILTRTPGFGDLGYELHLAVAPTKNIDRFEWLLEKATEMGITTITPLLTNHAERTRVREDRLERILVAAAKQSYKGKLPLLKPITKFQDFLTLKHTGVCCIAHCYETPRTPLIKALKPNNPVTICIGPEGDFSPEEVETAAKANFIPVSIGNARLRTETAGMVAVAAVYNYYSGLHQE